jgi:HK97 gp10 family phage protein
VAPALKVSLFGDREIAQKFKTLPTKVANKVLRQALRPAAKIVLEQAKKEVPVVTGALKKSLKVRAGKRRKGSVKVLVQTAEGFFKGKTYYGGFVHFGHRIGSRRLGDSRKLVPPNPFVSRAFEAKSNEALATTERLIAEGVERESLGKG